MVAVYSDAVSVQAFLRDRLIKFVMLLNLSGRLHQPSRRLSVLVYNYHWQWNAGALFCLLLKVVAVLKKYGED
jgi:hypothetical protein